MGLIWRRCRGEGGRVPLPPGTFVVSCPTGRGQADSLPQARCAGTRFTAFRAVPLARRLGPVTDCVQLQDLCMMHGIKKSPVRSAGSCVQGAEPVLLAGFPEAEAAVKLTACKLFPAVAMNPKSTSACTAVSWLVKRRRARLESNLRRNSPAGVVFQFVSVDLPNYSMNSSGRCSNWFTTAGEN